MQKDLQQLFKEFISECQYSRGLRSETLRGYEAVFKHFSLIMPEVTSSEFLNTSMLNEFFKRIQTRKRIVGKNTIKIGIRDSTIKTYNNKLNAFIVWLIQRKILLENPLDNIKLKNPEYTDQRALDSGDVNKIYTAITLHSNNNSLIMKRDIAMVSLLFFCGLRAGEFINLRVIDIDMQTLTLTVRAETSKSKKSRRIPIHPTLKFHLAEYFKERNAFGYKTENLFVSNNEDKGLSRHGLKHWVKRLIKISAVKFHLHRFRHTFACNLAKANVHIVKIQKLMGHADIKMTVSYLRSISFEDARDDISRLNI